LSLVEQVEKVNTERKIAMAGRIEAAVGGSVRDKTVGVRGVTFKPNTDDMRGAKPRDLPHAGRYGARTGPSQSAGVPA